MPSFHRDRLVAEVGDDAQPAAECLDVGLQRAELGSLQLAALDVRHASLRDVHGGRDFLLCPALRLTDLGETMRLHGVVEALARVGNALLVECTTGDEIVAGLLPAPSHSHTSVSYSLASHRV